MLTSIGSGTSGCKMLQMQAEEALESKRIGKPWSLILMARSLTERLAHGRSETTDVPQLDAYYVGTMSARPLL